MFSFSDPRVYIEIDENRLFIGRLRKKKGYFVCDRFDEWPLTSFEVKDGVIFKPSVLYLLIRSFLVDYHLRGAKAVVCCPYLAYWRGVDKRMPFFQAALYISKSGLKIHSLLSEGILSEQKGVNEQRFFHKDKLKSRFDFFCHFRLKNKESLFKWLGAASLLFAGVGTGLSGLHVVTYRRSALLREKRVQISKDVAQLQIKIKRASGDRAMNVRLKQEIAAFGAGGAKEWGIVSLIHSITKSIPSTTWLDEISVMQGDIASVKGYSSNYQDILIFYKDIVGRGVLQQCSLNYQQSDDLFVFTVAGKVVST